MAGASTGGAEDECLRCVVTASVAENAAIELDRAGDTSGALARYAECERELAAAVAAALPLHAEDHPKLVQHRKEVLDRIAHLKSLNGRPPSIPVEDQIKAVQLGMQATSAASAAVSSAGGVKTLAACAAMGAGAGFMVLGGTLGVTISLVGGAAAATYAATRQDKVGDTARKAGDLAVAGADRAVELNREHRVTEKIAEAGSKAVVAAKQVDGKYGLSDKVTKGVGAMISKAQTFEEKHKVTDKVASGISMGLSKLSAALDKGTKGASSSAAGSGSASG